MACAVFWKYACIAALTLSLGLSKPANAQEDAEDSPYRPGLIATYALGDQRATRTDEVIAFDWQTAACDPRLPAGPFTAEWTGRLWARGAGTYWIASYVQGEVTVKLGGKTVISGNAEQPKWLTSEPLGLEFDYHSLEIAFRRTQPKGQLAIFWSGPDFRLEPVPERSLVHERDKSPSAVFERGRQLAAALRCGACHVDQSASIIPAPALDRLTGNVHELWLIEWLSSHTGDGDKSLRRMPDLGMTRQETEALAAWLLREPAKIEQKQKEQKETKVTKEATKKADSKSGRKSKGEEKPKPSAEEGERLILSRGCLACHKYGEFGESGLFGGGDLTGVFNKRPVDFVNRWLQDPAAINKQHRMPVFTFTSDELTSLSLWAKEHSHKPEAQARASAPEALLRQGEKLVGTFHCAACHAIQREGEAIAAGRHQPRADPPRQNPLSATSDWSHSCAAQPRREKLQPGYRLASDDQAALRAYYSAPRPGEGNLSPQARGHDLLVQLNCLACHQREGIDRTVNALPPALQDKLVAVSDAHSDLAPLVPAMTPPALNSVGDKLHDAALADAISRQGPPHRPYLLVQMPKFNLTKDQLSSLTAYFVTTDRIPSGADFQSALKNSAGQRPAPQALAAAGPRLVTADGLACTSCHQVGSVLPSKAPLNARGPDMSMLGKRIRREWFDRWCDNPARIVPRMEMPAVKVPVRGVLNDKIDDQLAAVWHILNTPGFEPPEPNPVRVVRLSGVPERNERPVFIRDVVKDRDETYLYPLVIGLPNRHNVLFDLQHFRLAAWWLGDTARQRTKGKTWYWETGGKSLLGSGSVESEISLVVGGRELRPKANPQFPARLDRYGLVGLSGEPLDRPRFTGWLTFPDSNEPDENSGKTMQVEFGHGILPLPSAALENATGRSLPPGATGFAYDLSFRGRKSNPIDEARLRLVSPEVAAISTWDESTATLKLPGESGLHIRISAIAAGRVRWNGDGSISAFSYPPSPAGLWSVRFFCEYFTTLPVDVYLADPPPVLPVKTAEVAIAPGFVGTRLPLADDIMPAGLSWTKDGKLVFATLKGQVFKAIDGNNDGDEDTLRLVADGLATPYGISALPNGDIDVTAKDGLQRLVFLDQHDRAGSVYTAASGWGMTDDYHDWAVGLVGDEKSGYYLALPCQQDQRTEAAATLRGKILKLFPRRPQFEDPRLFDIEVLTAGHRFPMGLARNRDGELFVTDNQGNYNPFNELNHVKQGAHFGFINALEKQNGYVPPPLTPPAINIPHPWTRSVNGICFLDTPPLLAGTKPGPGAPPNDCPPPTNPPAPPPQLPPSPPRALYGPFEGHLVGCEYDTRRLIRMSLDKVNGEFQGCAYPLSIPPDDVEKGLLGPIVCAIKPTTGELYVGEIRDSGWGASNNIGQIVKIKIEPEKLPCGIAEVRATSAGFTIDFIQPVDKAKAADLASYSIQSYRRESTPAYGGPDLDRRAETISTVDLSADGKRVTLTLPELRRGHVYELRTKNLAPGSETFHPGEAHYTLNQIPD